MYAAFLWMLWTLFEPQSQQQENKYTRIIAPLQGTFLALVISILVIGHCSLNFLKRPRHKKVTSCWPKKTRQ